jgi:1-acyl-sn-glycerol-3-phosphate acyltransferase
LARFIFFLTGWKTEGELPEEPRYVVIAAPHTSNWDAVFMVTAAFIFGKRISWFLKDAAFFWPLGPIVRAAGAIPIDRKRRHNVVAQAVERFQQSQELVLAVAPEGTRRRAAGWKTGFYHIANGARVPIVFGYLDYERKVAGLGPCFMPTGDLQADFRIFDDFYAQVTPRHPDERAMVTPQEATRSQPLKPS